MDFANLVSIKMDDTRLSLQNSISLDLAEDFCKHNIRLYLCSYMNKLNTHVHIHLVWLAGPFTRVDVYISSWYVGRTIEHGNKYGATCTYLCQLCD